MKLILAIVRDTDESAVLNHLVERGYRVTRMASTGGFLRRGKVTLMIGVDPDQVDQVIALLRDACGPADSNEHRVTLFVLNAAHFEQI